ncbi:50S ribosomal protein L28 [Candidatus Phytoplasma bonamiae]|uniref:Large ribosomal subunit protein bL28 n=1 Tax=Candidatus Phytoplasma bonamiae TaxID=2982626 RepID=A0ABT9D451_9MOLU|nr:50S ribosomal protein L28 ['Bonamia sp.' little leaf phytoplasma]MDO8064207.1 50S ribosomal protein L28 ['Bonamia sp.' little leaf phytoplasma]MDV3174916.1 50S ribosomal protein L28 ['Bonamia sp.' little leaf phytoplasma]
MAKCYLTGKAVLCGNKRSHAMNATKRKWKANLQKIRIIDDQGKVKKVFISVRALKKMNFQRI